MVKRVVFCQGTKPELPCMAERSGVLPALSGWAQGGCTVEYLRTLGVFPVPSYTFISTAQTILAGAVSVELSQRIHSS